jgi:hypothetical protein
MKDEHEAGWAKNELFRRIFSMKAAMAAATTREATKAAATAAAAPAQYKGCAGATFLTATVRLAAGPGRGVRLLDAVRRCPIDRRRVCAGRGDIKLARDP